MFFQGHGRDQDIQTQNNNNDVIEKHTYLRNNKNDTHGNTTMNTACMI